ncbi:nuclear transport factor 2 family protein [Nocardia sp. SSK8]|uniref:nuclear transport factor 2 family protein n=1 Tax=Nocardia sp. SSK8 TaxID=3120154 RepID=UPI00300B3A42
MSAIDVFNRYGAALAAGDMAALASTFDENVIWHQPGGNPLSGEHHGPGGVVALLGRFMELSAGTFALEVVDVVERGDLVAATVRFRATRAGRTALAQNGVDVFRVRGDAIAEVWLISEDQPAEDEFWG